MRRKILTIAVTLTLSFTSGAISVNAQGATGSLRFIGQFSNAGKTEKLVRKRFYLFRGGLAENKALIDRIRAAEPLSRDCYYAEVKASGEFICWLETEDCDSPFCRRFGEGDIERVPEFKAAYQTGLTAFARKPELARDWLLTNLSPQLTTGFYRRRDALLAQITGEARPLQSSMTGTISVETLFVDIPVAPPAGKKGETFLVTNLVPIELGGKGYVWNCQIEIQPDKRATLRLPDVGKTVKACEVIVKDLKRCSTGGCGAK
ncbi:MAG: hypothetical protein ACK4S4_06865 [Pyrinomonadaceae bacterium]